MTRIDSGKSRIRIAFALSLIPALWAYESAWAGALSEKGEVLVTKNCARCHATGANGESPHKQAPPFRAVVKRYPLENLAEALAEGIVSGHADMPEFVFPPDEIDAILAYLGKLKSETGNVNGSPGGQTP